MNRFTWRTQYDLDEEIEAELTTQTVNEEPSLTQQQFAEDADLNVIMKRYGVTDGAIPPGALDPRYFGDFTDAPDFRQALDTVRDANEKFQALPADIRNRFLNRPDLLWAWVNDPANQEEAVRIGLLSKQAPVAKETPTEPTTT